MFVNVLSKKIQYEYLEVAIEKFIKFSRFKFVFLFINTKVAEWFSIPVHVSIVKRNIFKELSDVNAGSRCKSTHWCNKVHDVDRQTYKTYIYILTTLISPLKLCRYNFL